MSNFLEAGYEIPTESNYMKFEEGDNTFRILGTFVEGKAIMGMEYWKTVGEKRTPIRLKPGVGVPMNELEINSFTGEPEKPRHFWALPVWNVGAKKIQILEITQKTIQQAIKFLSENPKWGDPKNYDLVVTKTKEGGKTTYSVTPDPKEPVSSEVLKTFKEMNINIQALYDGKDPFSSNTESIDSSDSEPEDVFGFKDTEE